MYALTEACKHTKETAESHAHAHIPKFNRMSGIMEWVNAVCLFVNIDPEKRNRYHNAFMLDSSRRFLYLTWYAQPRQNTQTPVIQRLMQHCSTLPPCSPTSSSSLSASQPRNGSAFPQPVHTSIRQGELITSTSTSASASSSTLTMSRHGELITPVLLFCRLQPSSYVYCGELRYVKHYANTSPLCFLFELVHAKALGAFAHFNEAAADEQRSSTKPSNETKSPFQMLLGDPVPHNDETLSVR